MMCNGVNNSTNPTKSRFNTTAHKYKYNNSPHMIKILCVRCTFSVHPTPIIVTIAKKRRSKNM